MSCKPVTPKELKALMHYEGAHAVVANGRRESLVS